ncbi:hypothetical protein Dsin_000268 [Dipteronia sinensis]|uniref:RNase H type-1 domain-containing protein n=1 Tax=Dipteronia sinensis TaxID=43782 RepID=A0AAE0B2X3_9ROSI|nr:hypothetical protein Dsin_000268 [Dipteronia sinensis]
MGDRWAIDTVEGALFSVTSSLRMIASYFIQAFLGFDDGSSQDRYLGLPSFVGRNRGFRDLSLFNQDLLAKQVWRLLHCPNSLAAQLLKLDFHLLPIDREGILSILVNWNGGQDCLAWHFEKNGLYSVKSGWGFIALREGLLLAKFYNISVRIVEVNASSVVSILNSSETFLGDAFYIVNDIRALFLEAGICECQFVPKVGNALAYNLASSAFSSYRGYLWLDSSPVSVS